MSSETAIGEEVSVDEQGFERADADGGEAALRPPVAQMTDAKVDANVPAARPHGMTLAAEERVAAREAEIARTLDRAKSEPTTTRERGARACAAARAEQARATFQKRRAAVTKWAAPEAPDPREILTQEALAAVNGQAARIANAVERGAGRANIARRLARRVADCQDILKASLAVKNAELAEPGRVVDIADIGAVGGPAVTIEGTVQTPWEHSHPAIRNVGLVGDETGRTKLTIWKRSGTQTVSEGECVRLRMSARAGTTGGCRSL